MTKLEKILTSALDELADDDGYITNAPDSLAVCSGKRAKLLAESFNFQIEGVRRIYFSNDRVCAITYNRGGKITTYGKGLLDKFKIK